MKIGICCLVLKSSYLTSFDLTHSPLGPVCFPARRYKNKERGLYWTIDVGTEKESTGMGGGGEGSGREEVVTI